jgi:hypothetical protein
VRGASHAPLLTLNFARLHAIFARAAVVVVVVVVEVVV